MKKIKTIVAAVCFVAGSLFYNSLFAQAPQKFSYQTVVRNASQGLVANQSCGIRISIRSGSATGTVVYSETHTKTSNINGLVTLEIGAGTVVSGTFNTINWGADVYFVQTQIDPAGGNNYTITGTSQLSSVPYALNASSLKCPSNSSDANDGRIGNSLFAEGLNITGINNDNTQRKIQLWGSIIQNENNLFNSFKGITTLEDWGPAGSPNLNVGDDAFLSDMDEAGVLGVISSSNNSVGSIKYGNNGGRVNGNSFGGLDLDGNVRIYGLGGAYGVSGNYPLQILGAFSDYWNNFGFINNNGPGYYNAGNNTQNFSLNCANAIVCSQAWAISDERVKKIEQRSDIHNDLATINKLVVTDYKYIDQISQGNRLAKGFIAQEVEKIIPEAVTKIKNYIPNIFDIPKSVTKVDPTNTLITMNKKHDLKEGDKVKIITDKENEMIVCKVNADNSFEVEGLTGDLNKVFVFGKEVLDFNVVEYDRIFTTSVGAIQELSKQNDQLKFNLTQVQKENEDIKAALQTLMEQMQILNAKVNTLENPVTGQIEK